MSKGETILKEKNQVSCWAYFSSHIRSAYEVFFGGRRQFLNALSLPCDVSGLVLFGTATQSSPVLGSIESVWFLDTIQD